MSLELENLLIERPVTLCYWDLAFPSDGLKEFFEKETAWKGVSSPQELLDWINYGDVKNLIVGTEDTERIRAFKQALESIDIEKRREIFFVIVSSRFRTLDPRESFVYSANLVVNPLDLAEFERIYSKARVYWERLYKPYRATLEKIREVLS